jgi:hypothetical protein
MNRILSDGERICWYLYGNSAWCGYMCVMLVSPPPPLQLDLLLLKPAMRAWPQFPLSFDPAAGASCHGHTETRLISLTFRQGYIILINDL